MHFIYIYILYIIILPIKPSLNSLPKIVFSATGAMGPAAATMIMTYKRIISDSKFFFEQNTTVNDKSTAGRFDPKVFVNCVQDKE